jgi:16S rRNA (cytidine1402-2'-O)-methyltransferase
VGTLYLVGLLAGDPDGLTLRALSILREVPAIAADDPAAARLFLTRHGISAPVQFAAPAAVRAAVAAGDVALLHTTLQPPLACVRAALEAGAPVVPIPGPSLPLAAAVISGLPADQLIFLGQLAGLDVPLASLAAERRTLVAVEAAGRLPGTVGGLLAAWGDRPVALLSPRSEVWRGRLSGAAAYLAAQPDLPEEVLPAGTGYILVIGGAEERPAAWDEARLHAEVESRLAQGQRARQIAQELATASGWPRRDIYRLATRPRQH